MEASPVWASPFGIGLFVRCPFPTSRWGDTLVVWRLDQLGRTTLQLVNLLEQCEREGIRLRFLQNGIDTTSVISKAMFQIGAVSAEMERNLLRSGRKPA